VLGRIRGQENLLPHSFEIPQKLASVGEYFTISIHVYTGHSAWKLEDESTGRQHNLPFSFESRRLLREFTIVPDETDALATPDYVFECILQVRPKLRLPIATMHSITTVEVRLEGLPSNTCPTMSVRRKGEEEWQTMGGCLITFTGCDQIYEVQFEYEPISMVSPFTCFKYRTVLLKSRILEVSCLWQKFDIEKEVQINQNAFWVQRKFDYFINQAALYRTQYSSTMRMIEPTDNEDYNKEIEVRSHVDEKNQTKTEFKLVPGARYEFKMHIKNIGVSIPRIIEVPADSPVDENLWRNFFGSADQVLFSAREAKGERNLSHFIVMEHEPRLFDIEWKNFVLYRSGIYSYKLMYQRSESSAAVTKVKSGGTFKLVKINSTTARICISKLYKSTYVPRPPAPILTPIDPSDLTQTPIPLQLPELIRIINEYANDHLQPTYRLVCKTWCLAIDATISGTLTPQSLHLFRRTHDLSLDGPLGLETV
jgi:hypothetical protein